MVKAGVTGRVILFLGVCALLFVGKKDRGISSYVEAAEKKEEIFQWENVPFVEIGPQWGEDKIDLKEIYLREKDKYKEEKIRKEEAGEYDNLAFANVNDYVNVRSLPSTEGEIVGRIFRGAVAEIVETAGNAKDWYKVVSGNVEGYIKAEYFLRGKEAAELMDNYIVRYAKVKADYLNVRTEPTVESRRMGFVTQGEKLEIKGGDETWFEIEYSEGEKGFISADYVTLSEEFLYAKTMQEIEEIEKQKQQELEKRKEIEESLQAEVLQEEGKISEEGTEPLQETAQNQQELRSKIVEYAKQYLGNRYVPGGGSLAGGTDCSGFTCFIYGDFGYSISRTPQGQFNSNGSAISYEMAQPGDIICYSSNGGRSCTHVAIYVGDGQIIHSANSRKGVILQNADYDMIIGVKSILN